MDLQQIYIGAAANDKTGTPARQAGAMINANFETLANEVFQDRVLKTSELVITALSFSIAANAFAWRINKVDYLTPLAFSATLDAATAGKYRYDILQGTSTGGYLIKSGSETNSIGTPPTADAGCIVLATFLVFDSAVAVSPEYPIVGVIKSTADVPENPIFLYFTVARVLATVLNGISFATGGSIVSTDTVLQAIGKLQKQISDNLNNKQNSLVVDGTGAKYPTVDAVNAKDFLLEKRVNVATKIWTGTQVDYDSIVTKNANTLYFIK